MKKERLLQSFSLIDEKYVKEAEPKMKKSTSKFKTFKRVACLALVVALSLYLFIPFSKDGPKLTAYKDSEYFPIIERIADYRYKPSRYKNNFEYYGAAVLSLFMGFTKGAPGGADMDGSAAPESNGNGSYVETTDNQVAGVIEADIVKRTDKYIFRLGNGVLKVYTIDKENTKETARFEIPSFADEYGSRNYTAEMYLSLDGKTVTVIKSYNDKNYKSKVLITSIDVSDPTDMELNKQISIDGQYSSSRMVDGKLLLISQFTVNSNNIDYSKPETYVPTIDDGNSKECIRFEDIIYPEKLSNMRYNVVSLMTEDGLDLLGANALLSFNGEIYVSANNVYVTRQYTDMQYLTEDHKSYYNRTMTEFAVLDYSGDTIINKGMLTVEGRIKDQYSMDEYEGHFRVVTSTADHYRLNNATDQEKEYVSSLLGDKRESATLSVFKLDGFEKIAEVKDFAPEGEEAASVRFDGTSAYVCTAVIVKFEDPVYFFDLSDYSNITYTDTGVIDGFSSSLINLGDGYLLGIGEENWQHGKVEVYEERDGKVESVDKYIFAGDYSPDYKSYLINRDKNMFGFGNPYYNDEQTNVSYHRYVLLAFNGYEIVEVVSVELDNDAYDASRIRAILIDDYLYITTDTKIKVVAIADQAEQ